MELKNKKILVSGGAGFIGSHTTKALIEKEAKVVIVDNLSTGRKENINPRAKFYKINIADSKVEEIFQKERPEIIYHFAFNVLVPESTQNPLLDMESIVGSINIMKNAQKFNLKKIIFSSSGFIYGNTKNLPTSEKEPMDPFSSYAIAKKTVEDYLCFFNKIYNLPYLILRYGTVYGPGQIKGAMVDYISKLAVGKQAKIWGDGTKTRDYVYIDDVVRANLLALDLNKEYPEPIFNVGTGIETSLNELYKKISRLLEKKPEPIYLPERQGELMRFCLDCSKIKKALNWQPKYKLEEGLKEKLKLEGLI